MKTRRVLWETNDLPGAGQCLGYSPDGRWLATGDFDTDLIEIRDARTGRRLLEIETKARRTWSTQFSPDGRYLATGGHGIRIYKIGDNGGSLKATLVKSSAVAGLNLLFTPDGRSLEFEENGPALFLFVWDLDKSPQPANLDFLPPQGVETESFTPDGHLVVIDRNGRIVTLELPTGKEISFFQARKPSHDISAGICLSRDGSRLAVTSESQRGVDIWDFKAGKRLYSLPDEAGTVYWLTWSPDGRRLTIARDNGNIAIWNLDTVGQILTRLGLNP